jgi:sugar phosphate isomerase/epimerase
LDINKLGANVACLADYSLEQAAKTLVDMNFQTIELLAFAGARHSIGDLPGFWFGKLTDKEKERLRNTVSPFQYISIHAPFIHTPLITHNDEIRNVALKQVKDAIDTADYLGGSTVVIHMNPKPSSAMLQYWDEMVDVCRMLGDYAGKKEVLIGVETGFPPGVEDYVNLITSIDHPAVGAAVDVGHVRDSVAMALRTTEAGVQKFNDNLIEIVSTLSNKVFHFHLHDVRLNDWRDHRSVGTGVIDFPRLFAYLLDSGYEHLMTFELEEENREEALLQSKNYIENTMAALQ